MLPIYDGSVKTTLTLSNVLYVPKIKRKLLSLHAMAGKVSEIRFNNQSFMVVDGEKVYYIGHKEGRLYKLNAQPTYEANFGYAEKGDSVKLWHYRLGHLGYDNMKKLQDKSMVDGLQFDTKKTVDRSCEGCAKGRQHRQSFPEGGEHKYEVLELIHSDVCGPMHVDSVGGSRYFVTFIDDCSRYTTIYFIKKKDQVLQKFKEYVAAVENQHGKKVKVLRSDNGGEYVSAVFAEYCISRGIKQEFSVPRTPEQNGISERMNRTIMEMTRSMLHQAELALKLWAEAANTAVYIRNMCPTVAVTGMTPYERWFGKKPNISHLRVFGCDAFVHIPDQKRRKLEGKSSKYVFIGYHGSYKGYKFYDPENNRMFISRDATFLEDKFGYIQTKITEESKSQEMFDLDEFFPETMLPEDNNDINEEAVAIPERMQEKKPVRRSQRDKTVPDRLGAITGNWWTDENVFATSLEESDEPKSMDEAMSRPDAQKWKIAADSEFQSLQKNQTWELVNLPPNKNLVGCKWLFKLKRDSEGKVDRYKARLVAQGYSQEAGLDYDEVFAPVARYTSIRTVLAIANALDLEVHQMDVKTAFLNGDLENDIYMQQPDGYVDKTKPNMVCKLKKSLYGLKQSARCWNLSMDRFLKESGYRQSNADPCIYSKAVSGLNESNLMIVALYVDDIILASNNIDVLQIEKEELKKKFEMEDQKEVHYCLGMTIKRQRRNKIMVINQKSYLESILRRFGMADCREIATPMEPNKKYNKLPEGSKPVNTNEYQALIGCLTYAAIATRPDIASAVGLLSQFMSNPGPEHWVGAKRILRYLKGTLNYGLKFDASQKHGLKLQGYSDADWGRDVNTRRSTSGYLCKLGGGTISWRSKRQSIVALSSTEAEYVALSMATQEAIWLRRLLSSIGFQQSTAVKLFEDNQGAIALSKNPAHHTRTKHIDVKYHFIRDAIESKEIEVEYCQTNKMIADILTKGLQKQKFEELRRMMGVDN